IGEHGPIHTELYLRTGPSLPVGSHFFKNTNLEVGWEAQIGGRSLFFNPELDAAWTLDLSLSEYYNHNDHPDNQVTITFPMTQTVTVRTLHRTYLNVGAGREWYLNHAAGEGGLTWRTGFDVGGRIGSGRLDFAEVRHRTDEIFGLYAAWHTDVE